MDEVVENIIAIRKHDISRANEAFADFMSLTEKCLNDKVKLDHSLYKDCGGSKMEPIALEALREVSPQTPFRKEEIELVSGAKFPDIQAEKYYGVEVKTTKRNSWRSVGSSIIESTRIDDVSEIYMLFAKLGGEFAEFRCRPYGSCLDNISLTHQPRYQIDMDLDGEKKKNIFQKMKTDYATFCMLEDKEKIDKVQEYFRSTHKEGKEMQWWIGTEDEVKAVPMTVSFLNDLKPSEKATYMARMFILFPELFSKNPTKFKRAGLWLCTRNSMICSNLRDFFTAGGRVKGIGNKKFSKSVPKILKRLFCCKDEILAMLSHPDDALIDDINELWPITCDPIHYKTCWMSMIQNTFNNNIEFENFRIEGIFEDW